MGKGMGGHQSASPKSMIWLTPRFVLDALKAPEAFDLDPCAAPDPARFPTAKTHYVERDGDGCKRRWFGRVWLNPPYGGEVGRWLARLAGHGTGTALVFARTETNDYFNWVWNKADALLFLHGRLTFMDQNGVDADSNGGAPSVLIAYGDEDADKLHDCGLDGRFVPLRGSGLFFMAQQELEREQADDGITWRALLAAVIERAGRPMLLSEIYALVRNHPKGVANSNVEAKVRQTLNRGGFSKAGFG